MKCCILVVVLAVTSFCSGILNAVEATDEITTAKNTTRIEFCDRTGQNCDSVEVQSAAGSPSYVCFKESFAEHAWYEVMEYCAAKGGWLAEIHDNKTLTFLTENVHKLSYDVWLGASDVGHWGAWRWASGRGLTVKNWASGEPSVSSGGCMSMFSGDGGWGANLCTQHINPLCETTTRVDCGDW